MGAKKGGGEMTAEQPSITTEEPVTSTRATSTEVTTEHRSWTNGLLL